MNSGTTSRIPAAVWIRGASFENLPFRIGDASVGIFNSKTFNQWFYFGSALFCFPLQLLNNVGWQVNEFFHRQQIYIKYIPHTVSCNKSFQQVEKRNRRRLVNADDPTKNMNHKTRTQDIPASWAHHNSRRNLSTTRPAKILAQSFPATIHTSATPFSRRNPCRQPSAQRESQYQTSHKSSPASSQAQPSHLSVKHSIFFHPKLTLFHVKRANLSRNTPFVDFLPLPTLFTFPPSQLNT